MARKVKIGTAYLFQMPEFTLTRFNGINCWTCNGGIVRDQWIVGKKRGNWRHKHYCLSCAFEKFIITKEEIEMFAKTNPTFEIPQPVLEVMMV